MVNGACRLRPATRYVEIAATDPDGSPTPTYDYQPKATGPDFDDKSWPSVIESPPRLAVPGAAARSASRGTGSR